jgi:hypothetical protein
MVWLDGREWGPLICSVRFVSKVEWLIGGDRMNECVTVCVFVSFSIYFLFKKIIDALSCHDLFFLLVIDSNVTGVLVLVLLLMYLVLLTNVTECHRKEENKVFFLLLYNKSLLFDKRSVKG